MNVTINILLDILILVFSFIAIVTSIIILFLIFHHRQQFPINTSTLLMCNTYLSIVLTCSALFDMIAYNLYSITHANISFNNWWCYTRAYLLHVGFCLIYHSYLFQACFRFFHIIYYQYKKLRSIRFIFQLILLQWLISFILIMPNLFFENFQYVSQVYHCLILYSNLFGLLINTSIIFYFPMIAIGFIYFSIIYYIKQTKNSSTQSKRQRSTTQRDIIVLRRIVSLVGLLLILSLPAIILWIGYMITGYLYPFSYHLQWLTFAFSLSILSIVSIFLTPQLKELLFEPNQSIPIYNNNNLSKWTQTCELKVTDV